MIFLYIPISIGMQFFFLSVEPSILQMKNFPYIILLILYLTSLYMHYVTTFYVLYLSNFYFDRLSFVNILENISDIILLNLNGKFAIIVTNEYKISKLAKSVILIAYFDNSSSSYYLSSLVFKAFICDSKLQ